MAPTTGCFLAACLLLAGAGLLKLARPASTTRALADLALPGDRRLARPAVARVLGLGELAVAFFAAWHGGRLGAGLVAAAFVAFAAVVIRLRRAGSGAACGCLGRDDTPASGQHAAVDLLFAGLAGVGLALPPTGLAAGGAAPGVLAAGAVLAALGYLLFAAVPPLQAARRKVLDAATGEAR
ncbi:MauE/DoxX family redox-associated membrane protein [Nakamurella endophytica]|uniref:Methylamine utilisation protein MauE domain-containing protein n=1 Tax=Nakamurella endophytica TaxID=1748367 RepID=A0A917TCD0_9ACTN|nr:MauE/DoxX family redox-associated membrane protein [Nakamurella endophytica]GGM18433.1 hypothetical protein GCM10011594_43140 [Nakamurella endophytica]